MSQKGLHLAVGRAISQKYTKYGSWEATGWVPGIAPSRPTPATPPRVHLPLPVLMHAVTQRSAASYKVVVGLRSVDQLTLRARFSDILGITEGYNLAIAGNPNDHFLIPSTK